MKKFLTTFAVLTVIATPAFAQSFDPDNGTGNVLPFSNTATATHHEKSAVNHEGTRAFASVPVSVRSAARTLPKPPAVEASATMKCSVTTELQQTGQAKACPVSTE